MQINQRDTNAIVHANQKDAGAAINLNKPETDFEFSATEFKKSSKSETESEIKSILNFNSDAGKLNKKSYLISRLYTLISI
jgi:hypothetical protein